MKRLPFTPEMFMAWRDGRKTVTRRLTKYDHPIDCEIKEHENHCFAFYNQIYYACEKPYYRPGETVCVVTRWAAHRDFDSAKPSELYTGRFWIGEDSGRVRGKWRPARFVPLHLENLFPQTTIVSARPERLKDITDGDGLREGITGREFTRRDGKKQVGYHADWKRLGELSNYAGGIFPRNEKYPLLEEDICLDSPRMAFANLWNTIHKEKPWESNPLVWRYELAPPGEEWRIV